MEGRPLSDRSRPGGLQAGEPFQLQFHATSLATLLQLVVGRIGSTGFREIAPEQLGGGTIHTPLFSCRSRGHTRAALVVRPELSRVSAISRPWWNLLQAELSTPKAGIPRSRLAGVRYRRKSGFQKLNIRFCLNSIYPYVNQGYGLGSVMSQHSQGGSR